MYAVLVEVDTDPGHEEDSARVLENDVLPMMRSITGIVDGYWLAAEAGRGVTLLVFETEDAANGVAQALPTTPRPDFARLGSIEVRPVIARL